MESRPSWNEYFLKIAETASLRSSCLSNHKGCVIVKDNQIISTGYNNPPAGIEHCRFREDDGSYHSRYVSETCPRYRADFESGEGLDLCAAVHAEANAIVLAASRGLSTKGAVIYCSFNVIPCRECAKLVINSGIKVVYLNGPPIPYNQPGLSGAELLKMAGVDVLNGKET
jgi:dCMP deaminase